MTIATQISPRPLLPLLLALSGGHLLNDLITSMIPAMYPLLKATYQLDFTQIGLITLAFHATASLLHPVLGYVTDHKPWAYAMVAGMASPLMGVVGLASAGNYAVVLVSVALVGLGSAVFHPEATRMARHAAAPARRLAAERDSVYLVSTCIPESASTLPGPCPTDSRSTQSLAPSSSATI